MRGLPELATKGTVTSSNVGAADLSDARGIRATDLMSGIMGMVPTTGGRKVVVGFHGDQAFCSFEHGYVNIPALPKGAVVPWRIALELYGFAAHEAAHLVWTDERDRERLLTPEEKADPLFHETWNCIEDYMIERNWLLTYEGAAKCFSATETRCCRKYVDAWNRNPDIAKDLRIVGPLSLTWLRSIHFGLDAPESAECLKTLPAGLQSRVDAYFDRIIDVQTTADCIEAAREIHADILKDPFDPLDPPADPSAGQPGQGHGQGQGQAGGQGGGQPGGQSGGPGSATGAPSAPPPAQAPLSTSATLDHVSKEIADQNPGQTPMSWTSFTVESNADQGPAQAELAAPEGRKAYAKAEAALQAVSATTASQLRRALVARTRERWRGGRSDGELDHRRVTDAAMGVPEIYRRKTKAEDLDTAVQIVIDCSGSMASNLPICQQLAIILHQAFYGTPVSYEILGFTTGDFEDLPGDAKTMATAIRAWNQKNGNGTSHHDVRAVSIYEFKGFAGKTHEVPATLGNMANVPMGGTPTADAIIEAHKRLARRSEKRHVMFVLTDGQPDDDAACKQAVKAVEGAGVSVIGLGIRSGAVKKCFRDWAMLANAQDLPALILTKVADALKRDKTLKATRQAADPKGLMAA